MSKSFRATLLLVLALVLVMGATMGCSSAPKKSAAAETTETAGNETKPPKPELPPPPMLRDPRSAVYSYMVWISYAYRILDSEIAHRNHAFSDFEEVRVNSYVQLNRQEERAIDQIITGFDVKKIDTKENTATVSVVESWRYRYIDLKTGLYKGDWNEAVYDSTYTVVKNPKYGWQVDKVDAKPRGEVK